MALMKTLLLMVVCFLAVVALSELATAGQIAVGEGATLAVAAYAAIALSPIAFRAVAPRFWLFLVPFTIIAAKSGVILLGVSFSERIAGYQIWDQSIPTPLGLLVEYVRAGVLIVLFLLVRALVQIVGAAFRHRAVTAEAGQDSR